MYIYIVMGSEDGYCLTFSSKAKAMAYGEEYIMAGGNCKEEEIEVREFANIIAMEGSNGSSVEIIKDKICR